MAGSCDDQTTWMKKWHYTAHHIWRKGVKFLTLCKKYTFWLSSGTLCQCLTCEWWVMPSVSTKKGRIYVLHQVCAAKRQIITKFAYFSASQPNMIWKIIHCCSSQSSNYSNVQYTVKTLIVLQCMQPLKNYENLTLSPSAWSNSIVTFRILYISLIL